jgi:hypothetical protein
MIYILTVRKKEKNKEQEDHLGNLRPSLLHRLLKRRRGVEQEILLLMGK